MPARRRRTLSTKSQRPCSNRLAWARHRPPSRRMPKARDHNCTGRIIVNCLFFVLFYLFVSLSDFLLSCTNEEKKKQRTLSKRSKTNLFSCHRSLLVYFALYLSLSKHTLAESLAHFSSLFLVLLSLTRSFISHGHNACPHICMHRNKQRHRSDERQSNVANTGSSADGV